ncbi:TonB-dependent receptor [Flavobacterium sp. MFBS3-15]|uniref:TonB-dependent receptor n=1 Tax=Flavobacterium sp. MFBS3-15 TaxID=2989816 RepID=UPI0022366F27|nr:TonB-dependent receptor [Flavobacterium sp. MFBS3-15]MCW4469539.1 TonB-dependent receptor [Flavobacterium sp. MFBS3-15]
MRLLLFLLLFTFAGYSQSVTLRGVVTDSAAVPLESATVYLMRAKDSSVVDYTITSKSGSWELKVPPVAAPANLKISFMGIANHSVEMASVEKDRDFGTVQLKDLPTELNEVVIESEIPPIRIKKDTLEFNASSFKVRPDANVEALLRQLPGVVITPDKKITVNGKEVNQILVNGKPFFDADGQIALQNLPADMIDKVQVTDTKTKKEELAKQQASGDNASINLTIKKDKNKGLFGRVTGGYGSDGRYEVSGLLNYFKDKRKISVLGSSNNINSSGFSMDEIFGSVGRGAGPRSLVSGGGNAPGITISNTAGVNYNDEWFKGFEPGVSYNYSGATTENRRKYEGTEYLPEGEDADNPGTFIDKSYNTKSESRNESESYSHSINGELQYKIDSTATLNYMPRLRLSNSNSTSASSSFSNRMADGKLLNESTSNSYSESETRNFGNSLTFFKSFTKKGRGLSVHLNANSNDSDRENLNRSNTIKYKYPGGITGTTTDNRNQILDNTDNTSTYSANVEFIEPLTDSLSISLTARYSNNSDTSSRNSYDYDPVTNTYSVFNDSLSNYLASVTNTLAPVAGFSLDKSKLRMSGEFGAQFSSFRNNAEYIGQLYNLDRDYLMPQGYLRATYRFTKTKSVFANYRYSVTFPQPGQLLPVEDLSNPLNTIVGNPNLDLTQSHTIRAGYRNFNNGSRSGINASAYLVMYDDQVTQYATIDESAKRTTSYRNISGNMNASVSLNWNKTFKQDAHEWLVNTGLSTNFSTNKGYLNTELYNSRSIGISPNVNVTYRYGELLTLSPSYNFNYNEYNYDNYSVSSASGFMHTIGMEATSYWPKHTVAGLDFGYTYNSNIPDGFRKDFYLLNTSVGYNFLKDDLMFKVKVYDLLNQNTGVKRTIEPTSVSNEENTVLKRYVMFSLTWKFNKFGSTPAPQRQRGPRMR